MRTNLFSSFFLFLFCYFACLAPSKAQQIEDFLIQIKSIGINENLGKYQIKKTVQDKHGFYWLATAEGLYRFDGKQCTYYGNSKLGLEKTDYLRIVQDANANIWLYSIDTKIYKTVAYKQQSLQLLLPLSANVECVKTVPFPLEEGTTNVIESNHHLFIVKYDTQVFELNGDSLHYLFSERVDQRISDVTWSEQNQVYYFLSCGNLHQHDPAAKKNSKLPLSFNIDSFESTQDGLALHFHSASNLTVSPGFCFFNFKDHQLSPFFGPNTHLLGHTNKEWCIGENEKLIILQQRDKRLDTILSIPLQQIFETDERPSSFTYINGNYWFFFHQYAKVVRFEKKRFKTYLQAYKPTSVRDFKQAPQSDQLYISTYSGHRTIDLKTGVLTQTFPKVTDRISPYGMTVFQDSILLVGMHGTSLLKKNLLTQENNFLNTNLNNLGRTLAFLHPFEDPQGRLWVGCERGLIHFPSVNGEPQLTDYTHRFLEDKKIELVRPSYDPRFFWLATSSGAYLLDTEQAILVDSILPFANRHIRAVIPMGKDSLWVLPAEDHAYLWHVSTDTWDTLKLYQPLLQNSLHVMQRDPAGAYWFTSDHGLFRYDPITKNTRSFTQEKDELPFNEFNKLAFDRLRDGQFLAGGINGFISWNPLDFVSSSDEAEHKIQLQSIRFSTDDDETTLPLDAFLPLNRPIRLPANLNQLQFDFDLMDVIANDKRYYFRVLKKQDNTQWSELGQGKLILSGLSSGNHRVQLAIKEGLNQDFTDQISIHLIVPSPWFSSGWGLLLWVLLLFGIILLIGRFRLRQAEEKNLKLEALISERTLEIEQDRRLIQQQNQQLARINSTKDRLFGLLGHELRAPLIGVIGLSKKANYLLRKGKMEDLKKMSDQLDRYANDTQSMLQNLLSWGQVMTGEAEPVIEDIHLRSFIDDLLQGADEKIVLKQLTIHTNIPPNSRLYFDEDALHIILRNLLDNAIKFSHPGGAIHLNFQATSNNTNWQLHLKDEGIGIPPELIGSAVNLNKVHSRNGTQGEKGTGLGLHLCRELATRNQCILYFEANQPIGTIAILKNPETTNN